MRVKDFIVVDTETTGLVPGEHEVVQLAALAYDCVTLKPYADGEFCSYLRPLHPEKAQAKALEVNGLSLDFLALQPHPAEVWKKFLTFLRQFNKTGNAFDAPLIAGKNIRNFDIPFINKLSELYSPKKGSQVLFDRRTQLELEDILYWWHEGRPGVLPDLKMDTLRERWHLSKANSHDALTDVRQTGELITRFLQIHREFYSSVVWPG